MEVAFRSSETAFFRKSFVLAGGNGFFINYKLYAFIRSFSLLFCFSLWTIFLKLGVNLSCSIFSIPNLRSEAVFPASGNELFMEYIIPASGNAFSA